MTASVAELSSDNDLANSKPTIVTIKPEKSSRSRASAKAARPQTEVKPRPISSLWSSALQRVVALILIVACSPLMLLLYLVVKATSKGPFLYSQLRPGLHGKLFRIWKVRSMVVDSDSCPKLARRVASGDPRVTTIGRFMRKTKLDEVPQLWNVLRGEMSFVGPRPIAESLYLELCDHIPGFEARNSVRPGLSNIGQVSIEDNADEGHLHEDWKERFEAELHYINHRSVVYDLVVIFLTAAFLMNKSLPQRLKNCFLPRTPNRNV